MTATARFFGLDPDLLRDPWPVFTAWRDEGPVARLDALDGWVVTNAEVARAVLLDADTWSSEAVEGPRPPGHGEWLQELAAADPAGRELLAVPLQTLLGLDAPAHPGLRRVLAPWFSAAAIARLEPLVTGLVDELLPRLC